MLHLIIQYIDSMDFLLIQQFLMGQDTINTFSKA